MEEVEHADTRHRVRIVLRDEEGRIKSECAEDRRHGGIRGDEEGRMKRSSKA